MDLLNLLKGIGDVNQKEFKNCLLKNITLDFYYIVDFVLNKELNIYDVHIRKRDSLSFEIPEKVRLYDQSSKSKVGLSLSTFSINNKLNLLSILENNLFLNSVHLNSIVAKGFNYITDKSEFESFYKLPFRGYFTIAYDGVLLIDLIENYDEKIVSRLYKNRKYYGDCCCIYCNSSTNLLSGSVIEPGIKFISTTRKNEIGNSVYVRCMDCEEKVMKGFDLLFQLSLPGKLYGNDLLTILLPLSKDVRLWNELLKVRREEKSDLNFYERAERIFHRFERRGLSECLELVFQKNLKNIKLINYNYYDINGFSRLNSKKKFIKDLEICGLKSVDNDLPYYPKVLLEGNFVNDDIKWNLIMNVKNFWLGRYDNKIWDLIHTLLPIEKRQVELYKLFNFYLLDKNILLNLKKDKFYCLGYLVREIIHCESSLNKKLSLEKIISRFELKNSNYDYIGDECLIRLNYLKDNNLLNNERLDFLFVLYNNYLKSELLYNNIDCYVLGRRSVLLCNIDN